MFADFIRNIRLEQNLTLREFCRLSQLDPRYWSDVEQGRITPQTNRESLVRIAAVLGISTESERFKQLEKEAREAVPEQTTEGDFLRTLPLFCRTIRNDKPTKEELYKVARLLRRSN